MTQEQKAKAYDEALKWMRELYPGLHGATKEDAEHYFPELRESEDERIRKEIINYLDFAESHNLLRAADYKKKKGWIDWLEKQKEQNGEDEECTDFTIYHPLKNGKGKYECIPYSFYGSLTSFEGGKDLIDFLHTCFYTEEECNEWIKQQEQKELPPIVGDTDAYFEDLRMTTKPLTSREWFDEGMKYAQRLQKKQKHPDGCFTCDEYKKGYEEGRRNGFTAGYNKAMKEQKPAWSEEDEEMLNRIIETLSLPPIYDTKACEKMVSWLKSLRPHWKPSEEQMNYLCAAVDAAIRKHNESVSGYEPARVLKSLYEDLKKLM